MKAAGGGVIINDIGNAGDIDRQSRFFQHFPAYRVHQPFARLDLAPGQRPAA